MSESEKSSKIIGRYTMRRLLKKHGAKRVSDNAADTLGTIIEGLGRETIREAHIIANHSKRTTILQQDVKLARKAVMK